MGEVITALGLILGVLIAYLQIQKNQRASLQLQETHLRNELKLRLYERVSTVIDEAGKALSRASTQYFSPFTMFAAHVRRGFPAAPTDTAGELSANADTAQRQLSRVLNILEEYEIVFARFRSFRRTISATHSELLTAHQSLWVKVLPYLAFVDPKSGNKIGPLAFPSETELAEMEALRDAYQQVCSDIAGYLIDLQIETQNELLGDLFSRHLPPRHPADPNVKVLTRNGADLIERPPGHLI